jgi:hypothetical protein
MTFEVVDRPNRGGGNIDQKLYEALMATKDNGKAIKVQLPKDVEFANWQANVRAAVRKDGMRLRARHNKITKVVHCWVEPFDEERAVGQDVDLGVNADEEEDADEFENQGGVRPNNP